MMEILILIASLSLVRVWISSILLSISWCLNLLTLHKGCLPFIRVGIEALQLFYFYAAFTGGIRVFGVLIRRIA